MLIYKITNKINNKIYIGQTTQKLKDRIRNYKSDTKFKSPDTSRPIIKAIKNMILKTLNLKYQQIIQKLKKK